MRRSAFALFAPVVLATLIGCEPSTEPNPGTPVDLSYASCLDSPDTPEWFAYQDGSGAWTRVNMSASGAFNFTLTQGRGGIATYTTDAGIFVMYATTAELQANMPACNGGSLRPVSGSVTGYAALDNMELLMGTNSTTVFGSQAAPAAFTIYDVGAPETDLVAVRYRTAATTTTFEKFPSRIVLRRGVTGTATSQIDFASTTESFVPLAQVVTVTTLSAGESLNIFSNVVMSSTTANISRYAAAAASFTGSKAAPFYGLASSALGTGETQTLQVSATRSAGSTQEIRLGTLVYADAADKTITFGPSLGPVSVSGSTRPSASYTVQSGYDNAFEFVFNQGNGSSFRQIDVIATKGYLGDVTAVTLTVPDLTGASGFSTGWLPVTGSPGAWAFLASNADIASGGTVASMAAVRGGALTP